MPRYPEFAGRISALPGSVYERYSAQLARHGKNLVKLHIGDTCQHPVYPVPLDEGLKERHGDYNRYCNTFGIPPLRSAIAEKLNEDNQFSVTRDHILITGGAVNALNIAVASVLDPGEDMMILTPCWPFFPGIVKLTGGNAHEVPFYIRLRENPGMDIRSYLENNLTEKTAALYLNTPNNPSGVVMTREQLSVIAGFAKDHCLWLISDEAYDGLTYDGLSHISAGTLEDVFPQTVSVFTFSKIFMFAGLRVGYAVAEPEVIRRMNKIIVHQIYGPATYAQYMMIDPVKTRHTWMESVRTRYQAMRDEGMARARFDIPKPGGTYFYFFSIKPYLDGRDYWDCISEMMNAGIAVAPGCDFGSHFQDYIRVCFTGEPPEKFFPAIEKINAILRV